LPALQQFPGEWGVRRETAPTSNWQVIEVVRIKRVSDIPIRAMFLKALVSKNPIIVESWRLSIEEW
jgi:hypothetical protein